MEGSQQAKCTVTVTPSNPWRRAPAAACGRCPHDPFGKAAKEIIAHAYRDGFCRLTMISTNTLTAVTSTDASANSECCNRLLGDSVKLGRLHH